MNDLSRAVRLVLRRWAVVLACALIGALAAGIYGLIRPPVYQAVATVGVSTTAASTSAQSAYQSSMASAQRVTSYAQLVSKSDIFHDVEKLSDGRYTIDELKDTVSAIGRQDTVIVEIRARDTNAQDAAKKARLVYEGLADLVRDLETPPSAQDPQAFLTLVGTPEASLDTVGLSLPVLLALGLVLGLGAGVLLALLIAFLDKTVRPGEDLARLTGTSVLCRLYQDDHADSVPPTLGANAEAFRHLRTNLAFINVDNPPQLFQISSTAPDLGKTYVATRVALVLAEAGYRVVLIDGDLRKGTVAASFGMPNDAGLTTVLTGAIAPGDAVHTVSPGLDIIPCGPFPPNPSELLGSHAMRGVLDWARDSYDYVLLDSAPVLPVTDALVTAPIADAFVLTVRVNQDKRTDIAHLQDLLSGIGVNLAGIVVNGVKLARSAKHGYGYGYGYGRRSVSSKASIRQKGLQS